MDKEYLKKQLQKSWENFEKTDDLENLRDMSYFIALFCIDAQKSTPTKMEVPSRQLQCTEFCPHKKYFNHI